MKKTIQFCILLFAFCIFLTACNKCEHSYDNACDTACNECGEVREITHDYTDADCILPKTCKVCEKTEGAPLGHTPSEDDGDCTTPVRCSVCSEVATEASSEHTPGEDDGDCTTSVKCENCDILTKEAEAAHSFENAEWVRDDAQHWHVCTNTDCAVFDAKENHRKGADGRCPDCEYRICYVYTVTLDGAYKDVKLTLTDNEGESRTFYTDESGIATFELPKNQYRLTVEHYNSGYQWTDKDSGITLTEEVSTYQASFELLEGSIEYYIYLYNPDGTPCLSATMFMYDAETLSIVGAFVTNTQGWGMSFLENGDYIVSIHTKDGHYALAEYKKDGHTTISVNLREDSAPMTEVYPIMIFDIANLPFQDSFIESLPFDNSYDFDAGESIYLVVPKANGCRINLGTDKLTVEYGGNIYTPDENNSVTLEAPEGGCLVIKLTATEACTENISVSYPNT